MSLRSVEWEDVESRKSLSEEERIFGWSRLLSSDVLTSLARRRSRSNGVEEFLRLFVMAVRGEVRGRIARSIGFVVSRLIREIKVCHVTLDPLISDHQFTFVPTFLAFLGIAKSQTSSCASWKSLRSSADMVYGMIYGMVCFRCSAVIWRQCFRRSPSCADDSRRSTLAISSSSTVS